MYKYMFIIGSCLDYFLDRLLVNELQSITQCLKQMVLPILYDPRICIT